MARTPSTGISENAEFHLLGSNDNDLVQIGQTFLREAKELLDVDDRKNLSPHIGEAMTNAGVPAAA